MTSITLNKEEIFDHLCDVKDPEIPVVTIGEMGILREVIIEDDVVKVVITPTYSGCPAMNMIRESIEKKLNAIGIDNFLLITKYSPAWTTDFMSDATHEKLRKFGIAPPKGSASTNVFDDLFADKTVACPRCSSENTYQQSKFGSTPCKSLYYCKDCEEPFEHFKCH